MVNVFVYHGQDHEGRLLADVIRRFDRGINFQFLPIETPQSLQRMERFLERKGLNVNLPFVVVMTDLSAQETHTHKVIHGEAMSEWFQDIVRGIAEHGPAAIPHLRQSVFSNLSMVTLSLASLCLRPPELSHPQSTPPPQPPSPTAGVHPDSDPPERGEEPPHPPPPPPPPTTPLRSHSTRVIPTVVPIPPIRTAVKTRGRPGHNQVLPYANVIDWIVGVDMDWTQPRMLPSPVPSLPVMPGPKPAYPNHGRTKW